MAKRPIGRRGRKAPAARRSTRMRVPRKSARAESPVGVLPSYRVTCSGCFEPFDYKPKESHDGEVVCPLCEHSAEPPGKPFLEQMTRYSKRERTLFLKASVPIVVAVLLSLVWFGVLNARSAVPRTGVTEAIGEAATEIPVASTDGFPGSGTIVLGPSPGRGEVASYEGKTERSFTGVSRGEEGGASAHQTGTTVYHKGFGTISTVINAVFALLLVGLLGYGVFHALPYEKARWVAYF